MPNTKPDKPNDTKPTALRVNPAALPEELTTGRCFVVWKWQFRKGKWTKPPFNARTRELADCTSPETWSTFAEAMAAYNAGGWDGIGRVMVPGEGIVGIDLDKCVDRATGQVEPWAAEVLREFSATYAEISPSGTGIRIICRGEIPPEYLGQDDGAPKQGIRTGATEIYQGGRYLTLTGAKL